MAIQRKRYRFSLARRTCQTTPVRLAGWTQLRPTAILPSNQPLNNGLRYLRWGGDGEAVQPEKAHSVDKA